MRISSLCEISSHFVIVAKSAFSSIHNSRECFAAGAQTNVRGFNACPWQKKRMHNTEIPLMLVAKAMLNHAEEIECSGILSGFSNQAFALYIAVNGTTISIATGWHRFNSTVATMQSIFNSECDSKCINARNNFIAQRCFRCLFIICLLIIQF